MPDFVKQGEIVASNESQVSQEGTPGQSAAFDVVNSVEEQAGEERKTLYQQLQEDKELKQQRFQQQFESKNSGYKLDEKSTAYYESLTKKQLQKEAGAKRAEAIELDRFKKLKESASKTSPLSPLVSSNKIIKKKPQATPPILEKNSPKKLQNKPEVVSIVGDYSSDDDD